MSENWRLMKERVEAILKWLKLCLTAELYSL